jgi:hypothetical protein
MTVPLPDGLPPGRFATENVWLSDEFPQELARLWPHLLQQHRTTGLLPVLSWPDRPGRPLDVTGADALRLDEVLAAHFAEYRRRGLSFWTGPTPMELPEDVERGPHDSGPSFQSWPGLAPAVPTGEDDTTRADAALRSIAGLAATHRSDLDACRLALVRAERAADVPAALGWPADYPVPLMCALLRSWEERFGARVVALIGSELHVAVARPPQHMLSTADNIMNASPTPFPDYAASLVGRTHWWFWWD